MIICENCGRVYDDEKTLECPLCEKERFRSLFENKSENKKSKAVISGVCSKRVQCKRFIWLGILPVIGFFLPTLDFDLRWCSPFEMLLDDYFPIFLKFSILYSFLAGIAVIIISIFAKHLYKHISLAIIGIMPFFLFSFVKNICLASWLSLAIIGIYSGCRAAHFKPQSVAARIIGALGGSVYLISLFLPILPREFGVILFITPFKLIFRGSMVEPPFINYGLIELIWIILLAVASVLCIYGLRLRKSLTNPPQAIHSVWIWSSFIIFLVIVIWLYGGIDNLNIKAATIEILDNIKVVLVFLPLLLIAMLSVADLLIYLKNRKNLETIKYTENTVSKNQNIGLHSGDIRNKILLILCVITILSGIVLWGIGKSKDVVVVSVDRDRYFGDTYRYKHTHSALIYCGYSIIACGFVGFVVLAYLNILKRNANFSQRKKSQLNKTNLSTNTQIIADNDFAQKLSNHSAFEIPNKNINDGGSSPNIKGVYIENQDFEENQDK